MELILHQYDISSYSEKVRLALGLKGLAWRAVEIPAYAPKPDYTPLTAGYRRTPALQIGADVYCDTALILDVLEARAPAPTLYPGAVPALARAQSLVYAAWAEQVLFRPLALYITGRHAERFPLAFHRDRARLHGKPEPDVARVAASASRYATEAEGQLAVLEHLLGDGRPFLLGAAVSLADLAAYEAPWFLETIGGAAAFSAPAPATRAWMQRVAALGHGRRTAMTAEAALDIARSASPVPLAGAVDPASGLEAGDRVRVRPFGEDAPAQGVLLAVDGERIVIAHDDARVGRVHVHFPRLGYRLSQARMPV